MTKLIFLLSIITFIYCILFLIYSARKGKRIKDKSLSKLMVAMLLAIATFSYFINPSETSDLYRHFLSIDELKYNGFSASIYDELIGSKCFLYIISMLPSKHWLPFFSAIITYGLGMWIIFDYYKNEKCSSKVLLFSILFMLAIDDFYTVTSGIRCAMAMAFMATGIYLKFLKNKKIIMYLPFIVISLTIHSISYLVFALIILFKFIKKKRLNFLILLWGFFIVEIISVMRYLRLFFEANKLSNYFYGESNTNYVVLALRIILVVIILILSLKIKKSTINNKENIIPMDYIEFVKLFSLVSIGGLYINTIFIGRLLFLLGFLLIPFLHTIEKCANIKNKIIVNMYFCIFFTYNIGIVLYSMLRGISFII